MNKLKYSIGLIVLMYFLVSCKDIKKNHSVVVQDSIYRLFNMTFDKKPILIDSAYNYFPQAERKDFTAYIFYVFDVTNNTDSLIINQCKSEGFKRLPIIEESGMNDLKKYLKKTDSGYYKPIPSGTYYRFIIYNQSNKKFIVFQDGV